MSDIAVTSNRLSFLTAGFLACLMVSAFGCSGLRPEKTPDLDVEQSRFLGSLWNQGHAQASIVSQDGGFSYAVPGGSLWWFGDTFRGSRDETGKPHFSGGAVSVAVGLRDDTDDRVPPVLRYLTGPDGTVAQAIGFLPGESWDHHRVWPLGGTYTNGKSYVYYSLIEIGEGVWGFKGVGAGLARSATPLNVYERIVTAQGWRFPVAPVAVVAAGDWLYLYEVEKRNDRQGVWLSRVRPADIEDPQKYEFHCGPGPQFCSDKGKQRLLLKDIYGQTSLAWNGHLGKYVLASSSNLFHPREIRFHVADEPFGPWSEPVATIMVPEERQGKKVELVYCAYFHPELFRENGRIMNLTFSLHLKDAGFDANCEAVAVVLKP